MKADVAVLSGKALLHIARITSFRCGPRSSLSAFGLIAKAASLSASQSVYSAASTPRTRLPAEMASER